VSAEEKSETMHTGTLIEDLIATVERYEAQAGGLEMHKVWAETEAEAEDNNTEVVPAGSLNTDYDLTDSAGRTATASSSDLISPLGTPKTQFVSLLLKTSRSLMPTCGQCPLARRISLGTVVRLRSRFNNLQLPLSW